MLKIFKIALLLIWVILFLSLLTSENIRIFALDFCITNPAAAPLILFITQIIFGLMILPCSPLSAIAGILWGFELGILYSIASSLTASTSTLIVGKIFKNNFFKNGIKNDTFKKIKSLIESYKWMASAIAHANPLFPGSSIGYVFATTNISLKSYILGALIGTVPLQIIIVGIGSLSINWTLNKDIVIFLFLFILIIIFLFYIKFMPKFLKSKSFRKIKFLLTTFK